MDINFSPSDQLKLQQLGVQAVILFGSQALGTATAASDYDIGVIAPADRQKQIYDYLYDLLAAKINRLVDIDIVFLDSAPAELQAHVARHGMALYQARPTSFANFKERVMNQYADFAPLRAIFSHATLARISP